MTIADLLQQGHRGLLAAVSGLTDDEADNLSVAPHRTVRDIFAVVDAYENVLDDSLAKILNHPVEATYLSQYLAVDSDSFAQYYIEERQYQQFSQILIDYCNTFEHVMNMLMHIQPAQLQRRDVAPGGGRQTVQHFIEATIYPQKLQAAEQIRAFRKQLKKQRLKPSK